MKDKILKYISIWENRCYPKGIPDEVPLRLQQLNKVPNYKAIVIAILKNDVALETLGFSKPKCNAYKQLKKIEISQRINMKNAIKFLLENNINCDKNGNILSKLPSGQYGLLLVDNLENHTMESQSCYTIINHKLTKIEC